MLRVNRVILALLFPLVVSNPGFAQTLSFTIPGTDGLGNDVGWRMMSLPTASATRFDLEDDFDFTAETGEVLYVWDGSAWAAKANGPVFIPGTGFILYFFDDEYDTLDASGVTIDVPGPALSADVTVSGLPVTDAYVLLGNPFPKELDVSAIDLVAAGFQNSVQYWNPRTSSFNVVTESIGSADTVPAWQGFFAERTTVGLGATALTLSASGQLSGPGNFAGKGHGAGIEGRGRIGLALSAPDPTGGGMIEDRSAVIVFDESASDDWDALDLTKIAPLSSDYVWLSIDEVQAGRTVSAAQASRPLRLPATFALSAASYGLPESSATIRVASLEGVPASWRLELEDTETGSRSELSVGSEFRFQLPQSDNPASKTSQPNEAPAVWDGRSDSGAIFLGAKASRRFLLHVTDSDLPTAPPGPSISGTFPNPAADVLNLEYKTGNADGSQIALFDLLGRQVLSRSLTARSSGVTQLDVSSLPAGLYFARVSGGGTDASRAVVVRH